MTRPNDLTDLGNSELFVAEHEHELRFVAAWNKWLAFDGRRWCLDQTNAASHLAKMTVQEMYEDAVRSFNDASAALERAREAGDEELARLHGERLDAAKPRLSWALKSHERPRIEAMVHLAKSAPALAVSHEDLDADPWLLNVANGTLDLRTGELRPHRRDDLITRLAPVAYDADAKCPKWDAFLECAQAGSAEMIEFIRRAAGYCLTGVIREHVLLFLFGPGGTGKSTFFRIQHAVLGDYAVRAPRSLLFVAKGEKHPTELATLRGARFASLSEIEESARLDEALAKDLTGGESIAARRMREDFWTFAPSHKLAIGGNHKPHIRNFDDAIRRRIRLIPWLVKPAAEDTTLFDKLASELPGILAWAVRGCLEWQKHGLGEPLAVRDATDAFQDESDPLREFFDLHCVFEAEARVPRAQLRVAYETYCKENGGEPLGAVRFAAGLKARHVTPGNVKHAGKTLNGWRGVRLATDAERERVGSGYLGGTHSPMNRDIARARSIPGDAEVGTNQVPTTHREHCFADLLEVAE